MKRLLFIIIAFLLSSCTVKNVDIEKPNVQNTNIDSKVTNAIIVAKSISEIDFANKMGIKNIIISSKGVRIDDKNYRTDFERLRGLDVLVEKAKQYKMNFYIEITSGPGYDVEKRNFSLFRRDSQKFYFAQMMNEIIKRYDADNGFKGIGINIENPGGDADEAISYIYSKVNYSKIIYNINLPDLNSIKLNQKYPNIVYLNFKSLNYPGYSMLKSSNIEVNRNSLLASLQNMKEQNKSAMVRVSAPWSDEHDVFLQDLYELSRILNFDIILDNTSSIKKCPKLLKILRKMVPVT
ncbi:hypothetical protein ABG79_00625 [Caloramator mitchellensis]|uniref:Uncharacterized protein n=1 Tax=Caloramator mitchellensis TaxID=908809 RepID=A0A0R3K3A9_CALMK|nr:hypothetical protein [Caloramator mitchellensis]KRQ87820.1 hypothetical protein ABG79_00625 [Caloramator mitchellensis]